MTPELPPKAARAGVRTPTAARPPRAGTPLVAYVLHRYDWSETSLIVELFTRERGRIVAAAKGAKRPTSQLRPVLLPFQPLHALLGRTPADEQGEVQLLRGAEWVGGRPLLGAGAMFAAYHANELLLKLLARQDPHPALFDAYASTLDALAVGDAGGVGGGALAEATALRAFELLLLRALGWLPDLALATSTAQPVRPTGHYLLDAEAGIVAHADGLEGGTWVTLEAALAHGSTAALQAACAPVAGALRAPLRALLHYHLGHARLRTREVWRGVQRLAEDRR